MKSKQTKNWDDCTHVALKGEFKAGKNIMEKQTDKEPEGNYIWIRIEDVERIAKNKIKSSPDYSNFIEALKELGKKQ